MLAIRKRKIEGEVRFSSESLPSSHFLYFTIWQMDEKDDSKVREWAWKTADNVYRAKKDTQE